MTVLAILGVMMALVTPRMERFLARTRARGAIMMMRGDLAYARMAAVRAGHGSMLRFIADPGCAWAGRHGGHSYRIITGGPAGSSQTSTLRTLDGRVCYALNGSDSLAFNSRGLLAPYNNRTIWAMQGAARESLTVSVAGRILVRQ
jgi:Tfp pilus assembly protein FimT